MGKTTVERTFPFENMGLNNNGVKLFLAVVQLGQGRVVRVPRGALKTHVVTFTKRQKTFTMHNIHKNN